MELIQQAIDQLQAGNRAAAARLFLKSHDLELIPQGITTTKHLAQVLSQEDVVGLISATAI